MAPTACLDETCAAARRMSTLACGECTYLNEANCLACAMCGAELRDLQSVPCPRCTSANAKSAVSCGTCGMELLQHEDWSCSACDRAEFDGWLECAHQACHECHAIWISSCDADGREPTCLTCDAEGLQDRQLSDGSIYSILGEEAYNLRATRLAERACALYYCPTTGCGQPFELDGGVAERTTTCPNCKKTVTLCRTSDAELVGQMVADDTTSHMPMPQGVGGATGSAAGTSTDDPIQLEADEESNATRRARETARAQVQSLLGNVKSCPKCGLTISKTAQSCNKFKCLCGHRFCWVCFALPDANGRLKCACPKTEDEHGFYEAVQSYKPPRKRPRE